MTLLDLLRSAYGAGYSDGQENPDSYYLEGGRDALLAELLSDATPRTSARCTCSVSISVLGDGCRYCQPQEYIDRLLAELEATQ